MALIDEIRKLLEELVIPEIRAIGAKLDAMREQMNRRSEEFDQRSNAWREEMNRRFDSLEHSLGIDEKAPAGENRVRPPSKLVQ
jgi:DNA anti-recombination protein RmuC